MSCSKLSPTAQNQSEYLLIVGLEHYIIFIQVPTHYARDKGPSGEKQREDTIMIQRRGHDRLIIMIIYRYYYRRRYHHRFSCYIMGLYISEEKQIIIYINQKSIILFVTAWHKKITVGILNMNYSFTRILCIDYRALCCSISQRAPTHNIYHRYNNPLCCVEY